MISWGMVKSFDRYLLKEIASPFALGLLVYTSSLLINMIFILSRTLIEKEASTLTIIKILLYLMPDFLSFTVPMATLMGVLAGLSRMSTDSEIVAFRTMGVNNARILRPVLAFAIANWLISSWFIMYLAPEASFKLSRLMTEINLKRTVSNIRPGDFTNEFPFYTLYFQDVDSRTDEWKNVFLFSRKFGDSDCIILAQRGKFIQGKTKKEGFISLSEAQVHKFKTKDPQETYELTYYKYLKEAIPDILNIKHTRRSRQLTFPNLVEKMRQEPEKIDLKIEYHRKFSQPLACIALGILALSLGISTRKGGKISGFTISLGIIFVYYTVTVMAENLARKSIIPAFWGMWGALIILFISGAILYYYTSREKTLNLTQWIEALERLKEKIAAFFRKERKILFVLKLKQRRFRLFKIIDLYVSRKILFTFSLIFISLVLMFYIIDIVELIDDAFQNNVPFIYLLKYVYYNTPEILSFIFPVSILTSVLLAFSLMSKNNEIMAVKVSGISLYRLALPAIILGTLLSLVFFFIQENITPESNKKARQVLNIIHKIQQPTERKDSRNWVIGPNQEIYFYNYIDARTGHINNFNVLYLDKDFSLQKRVSSRYARWVNDKELILWNGYVRDFTDKTPVSFKEFTTNKVRIELGKQLFTRRVAFPEFMNIQTMKKYIRYLKSNQADPRRYEAQLFHKYAFPFSSLIMVLIAIPFSFMMGNRGTLFGIGIAIGISMVFWFTFAVFSALGSAAILSPFLSSFGPLFIFFAASAYLFLAIKT